MVSRSEECEQDGERGLGTGCRAGVRAGSYTSSTWQLKLCQQPVGMAQGCRAAKIHVAGRRRVGMVVLQLLRPLLAEAAILGLITRMQI